MTAASTWWKEFSSFSSWITPPVDAWGCNALGNYTFSTSFNLIKYDSSKYFLNVEVASDDALIGIHVNDVAVPLLGPCTKDNNFATCTVKYSLNSNFKAGTNTISFLVNNAAGADINPVGLNANFIL